MLYNAYQRGNDGINGISVVSSGHIFAEYGRTINRPEGREDYLLFYVESGRELFHLSSDTVAERGGFVIFRPHEKQQHVYINGEKGEFYYVHFNAPADFDLFGFESSTVYFSRPDARVRDLFEEILNELTLKRPSYEKLCVSYLFTVMALLRRNTDIKTATTERYFDKISHVISIINNEYFVNCPLEEYADICNMSKYHFLRVFKSITGCSPIEYKNQIRLEHAKELLENTTYSVSEIGKRTGFMSDAYFCDAFKRKTGMSPGQYRKR
ncbi:MAG: AraC family transcriptional regulator [Ruminococcaceae bacterium]|nr:AraC family transcriptional regulator [Oscillospiraceae bacterium]